MSKHKRSTQEDKNRRTSLHAISSNSKVPPRHDSDVNNAEEKKEERRSNKGSNNDELDITV